MANRACLVPLDITHCVSTALMGRTVCPLGSALLCYAFAVKTGDLDYELPETIKRGSTKCRRIMPLIESAFTLYRLDCSRSARVILARTQMTVPKDPAKVLLPRGDP